MTRHLFVESKTTLSTNRNILNQSEKLTHHSRTSRDNRISNKENERDGDDRPRKQHSRNRTIDALKSREHGQRWSKNQSTSDKHRRSSKIRSTLSGSGSALSSSPSTAPNGIRSNLPTSSSPSRDNKEKHIPLSATTLLNDSRPPPRIKILDLHAEIESKPTLIDETSSSVLKYKTPQFKSHVTFQMSPIDENQNWKVGWIQACTHMEFFNTYGDYGYTSWEFPEMVTREKPLINDSDGRNYPWYGSSHQVVSINGPISHTSKYTVTMRDFFHPCDEEIPRLTHIYRNQHFLVWLAAMDLESKDIYILRTVEWKKIIEIAVDPKRQRGRRSTLISNPSPEQPIIYEENLPIPTCALYPPTANSAQVLVWRPTSGQPTLVVPPKSIEINTTNYAHLPLARY